MHVESFVVCIVGKMAQDVRRDDVRESIVVSSHLVWFDFEGFIPTCDDLPILVTCQSGALVIAKVTVLLPMKALDNYVHRDL